MGDIDTKEEMVTRETFNHWLHDYKMLQTLEDVDIDVSQKHQLFETLDTHMHDEVCINDMIEGLMKIRGPICKADITAIRLKVRHLTQMVEESALPYLAKIAGAVDSI